MEHLEHAQVGAELQQLCVERRIHTVLAKRHEQERRFALASQEYEKGLELLLEAIKGCSDPHKKQELREHARCFMDKAEKVKQKNRSPAALSISRPTKVMELCI